jgi:alpha-1,3-rhamnosyl/mannosyltransferase
VAPLSLAPLRITIDATSLLVRSAGVKNYIWHWLRHLRAQAEGVEINAFPFVPSSLTSLDHEASALSRPQTAARFALIKLMNETGLPPVEWTIQRADIFHATNLMRRAPRRAKLTATVHDLTCFLMPEVHSEGNIKADREFAEAILKRANGLIAVSENTRQDAIRVLGIPPKRIRTIYSGIADAYFEAKPAPRARPYALYVGTIEPRKNLDGLLDSWAQLPASLRAEYDLLIAGPSGWMSEKTFARIQREATYLGYVPEADLPGLTAGASAFVYPSLYEGFGFPVAQAMAAGAPVITSNNSCMPEIAGEAALLIDPRSASDLASALQTVLESADLRADLIARGREQAARFRWEACATESLQFFRGVAGSI